jgi:N-acetylglutamate synthase-like GNAT family acetyltransferase
MRLRPATHRDLPAIEALIRQGQLPDGDVAEHLATFLIGEHGGAVVACGGFEVLGTIGLLRSVVVAPRWRGRGWGERLVRRLMVQAQAVGLKDFYLLTTAAGPYFAARGFRQVPRETAPALLRRTRQFTSPCPSSAVLMHLNLSEENP